MEEAKKGRAVLGCNNIKGSERGLQHPPKKAKDLSTAGMCQGVVEAKAQWTWDCRGK